MGARVSFATASGLVVGAVQAGVLGGLLRLTRDVTGTGDRGFGQNPSIAVEAGWLLAFLVVSAILVPSAVAFLKVRHPVALAVPVLALELLVVSLLYVRRPASASEPT